jgi:hypothetical protein
MIVPADIEPNGAPGELVAVMYDADGLELDRAEVTMSNAEDEAQLTALALCEDGGGVALVVVYDGDDGHALALLVDGGIVLLPAAPARGVHSPRWN